MRHSRGLVGASRAAGNRRSHPTMTRPVRPALLLVCGVTLALLLAGCPKRPMMSTASAPAPTPPPSTAPTAPTPPVRPPAAAAAPPAPPPVTPPPTAPAPATPPRPSEYAANDALKDIYFAFDKADIRPGEVKTLDANGTWLKVHDNQPAAHRGALRRTRNRRIQLGARRAPRQDDDELPGLPRDPRESNHDRLVRQGAPGLHRAHPGVLGQEPPGPLPRLLGGGLGGVRASPSSRRPGSRC